MGKRESVKAEVEQRSAADAIGLKSDWWMEGLMMFPEQIH